MVQSTLFVQTLVTTDHVPEHTLPQMGCSICVDVCGGTRVELRWRRERVPMSPRPSSLWARNAISLNMTVKGLLVHNEKILFGNFSS